jgi:hypothetical protein
MSKYLHQAENFKLSKILHCLVDKRCGKIFIDGEVEERIFTYM